MTFPMMPGFPDVSGMFGQQQPAQPGYPQPSGVYMPQGGIPSAVLSGGNTPQQKGYGITDPTWPMAYDTGPGMVPGTPQDIQNGDTWAAGAAETQFANTADRYTQPGQMTQWWQQNRGQYQRPGMGEGFAGDALSRYRSGTPGVTQNSASAYQSAKGAQPNLSMNLDPYYENAKRRANEEIMSQMAARGMAGGTAGMDRAAEAMTDLNAEQANREAQYGLDRSGDLRSWELAKGQLAGQSDQVSSMASANERAWMSGLGDLALSGQNAWLNRMGQAGNFAGNADQMDLSRLNAGMNAAGMAQDAQRNRLGDIWNQQMQLSGAMGGVANNAYEGMFGFDDAAMQAQMLAEMGIASEAQNQSYRGQERIKDDVDWAWEKIPILGQMGGGGGGFGF